MNIGKYIFSQVIDFVPRYQFDKLVTKYKGDRHSRELNSYNHLLHLLFGQITGCDFFRDICSPPLKTIFQHRACQYKLYAEI